MKKSTQSVITCDQSALRISTPAALPDLRLCCHAGKLMAATWLLNEADVSMTPNPADSRLLLGYAERLKAYFAGEPIDVSQTIDVMALAGTVFERQVWQAVSQLRYGTTISYAKLAAKLGKPTAYRAVANAVGKNPLNLLIPCHRVIASHGGLGGYLQNYQHPSDPSLSGAAIKRYLLQLEGYQG